MTEKGKIMDLEKHKQLGMDLKILNDRLCLIMCEKSAACRNKVAGKQSTLNYRNAIKSLTTLKSCLENIMFQDFPGIEDTGIYYGERQEDFE